MPEPPLDEELGRHPAAGAVVAIQNHVPVWRDFRYRSIELPERDQSSAVNAGDSPLVRLTNINELDRVASMNAFSEGTRGNFLNTPGELAILRCTRCTQLIEVDERASRRFRE